MDYEKSREQKTGRERGLLLPDRSIRDDIAESTLIAHLPSRRIIGIIMAGGARDDMEERAESKEVRRAQGFLCALCDSIVVTT